MANIFVSIENQHNNPFSDNEEAGSAAKSGVRIVGVQNYPHNPD